MIEINANERAMKIAGKAAEQSIGLSTGEPWDGSVNCGSLLKILWTDICGVSSVLFSALVKVANVEWIKIASEEEISLMEGTIRTFEVVAGTNDGHIFESSQQLNCKLSP
ncbi:hypothetical protein M5K25_011149 [Dendrobium thyrsiflorum]|uniref:Uncharacterized protein n=1 Tax=Dendrobium thyrsiflorum TaxID=117978 RepID=A0ABD0V2A6_DENTH